MFGCPETRRSSVLLLMNAACVSSWQIDYQEILFSQIENTATVKKERLLKGVKYTLSRHFTMQCILLFTAYYSLATNYRNQSRSGCPAPSATGNSENFFTQKLSMESLHQRIRGTRFPFQETQ